MPWFRGEHSRTARAARLLAWAALSVTTSLPAMAQTADPASAREPVIRTVGAVSYVCGGVGEDEQQRMKARRQHFNLALLFTQGARGEYLSDVDVRLMRDGHDVARFRADGPLCLIKAPEGGYNVHATFNGQPRSVTVRTGSTDSTQVRW